MLNCFHVFHTHSDQLTLLFYRYIAALCIVILGANSHVVETFAVDHHLNLSSPIGLLSSQITSATDDSCEWTKKPITRVFAILFIRFSSIGHLHRSIEQYNSLTIYCSIGES